MVNLGSLFIGGFCAAVSLAYLNSARLHKYEHINPSEINLLNQTHAYVERFGKDYPQRSFEKTLKTLDLVLEKNKNNTRLNKLREKMEDAVDYSSFDGNNAELYSKIIDSSNKTIEGAVKIASDPGNSVEFNLPIGIFLGLISLTILGSLADWKNEEYVQFFPYPPGI